jgi:hypothetical protein
LNQATTKGWRLVLPQFSQQFSYRLPQIAFAAALSGSGNDLRRQLRRDGLDLFTSYILEPTRVGDLGMADGQGIDLYASFPLALVSQSQSQYG